MKSIRHIQKCFSPLLNLLCFIIFLSFSVISCGGGGGGAGGASIPASEYSTHNAGGWGGSGSSGGGNGGNGVNTMGGTPLVVDHYVYNGATYTGSQINDLIATIQNDTTKQNASFTVQFYVAGDSNPRDAKVTKGSTVVQKFEHQYKATCTNTQTNTTFTKSFYKDTGLDLSAETTTPNMAWLCAQNGQRYGSLITGFQGDITLSTVFNSPACEISLTNLPTGVSDPGPYEITDLDGAFGYTIAYTNGNPLPDGTTYSWQATGNPNPNTSLSTTVTCSASPSNAGITDSNIGTNAVNATSFTVTCDVTIPGEPTVQFSKQIKVFKRPTLTNFNLTIASKPSTAGNSSPYMIWNTSDTFTFAVDNPNFPIGTSISWSITDQSETTTLANSNSISADQMGTISTNSSTPTVLKAHCTISHNDMTNASPVTCSMVVSVYKVSIPAITVSIEATPTNLPTVSGAYKVGTEDYSKTFKFKANGSNIPVNSIYTWTVGGRSLGSGSDKQEITPTIQDIRDTTNVPTGSESLEVKCVVTNPNLAGDSQEDTTTVNFIQPDELPATLAIEPSGICGRLTPTPTNPNFYTAHSSCWSNNSGFTFGISGTLPAGSSCRWVAEPVRANGNGTDNTFFIKASDISSGNGTWNGTIYCYINAPGYAEKRIDWDFTLATSSWFGTKNAPDSLYDIVFSDGSASPQSYFTNANPMLQYEKDAAVAVIFYDGSGNGAYLFDSRMLGVGLQQGSEKWAVNGSIGYNNSIGTVDSNGLTNMGQIKGLSDYGDGAKYPAFKWADEYRNSEQSFNNGWYIPAHDELLELGDSISQINLALNAIGVTPLSTNTYFWTSTQASATAVQAYLYNTSTRLMDTGTKDIEQSVCVIHAF